LAEIKKSTNVKKFVPISDMVKHIYNESRCLMEGTKYSDNWFFYHDALSLMTSNSCKAWMEKEGILKHWLLPKEGLNKNTVYKNRPVGNSPELMLLDCSCIQYPHACVKHHIMYTTQLDKDDPKKFSITTINEARRAYSRIWKSDEVSLTPDMIGWDIKKTVELAKIIMSMKGLLYKDLETGVNA